MSRVNLIDAGLIPWLASKSPAQNHAEGIINRNRLRQLDDQGKNKWIPPARFWLTYDEAPPTGGPPFPWRQGPWIWLTHDTEIIGEDWDETGFLFDLDTALPNNTVLNCFRYQAPFSMHVENLYAECQRPSLSQAQGLTAFTHTPGKGGNLQDPHFLEMTKVKIRGGRYCVVADGGPTNSANNFTMEIDRCDFIAEVQAVACHNDVANGGGKSVHISRSTLGTSCRTISPGWSSSHVLYIAATVNVRLKDLYLHSWLPADYAFHHWGGGLPHQAPRYVTLDNVTGLPSGQGNFAITTPLAETRMTNIVMMNRTGIQNRGILSIDGMRTRHTPTVPGTISSISANSQAVKVTARNITVDTSYLNGQSQAIFDAQSSGVKMDIDGVKVIGNAPAGVTIFTSSALGAGLKPCEISARNVEAKGYHVPDADYANGVRSEIALMNMAQGSLYLADSNIVGDMSHDRGTIKAMHAGFDQAHFDNVKITAERGLAIYATQSEQLVGQITIIKGGIVMLPGVFQRLQLPAVDGIPPTITFASTLSLLTTSWRQKVNGGGTLARALVNGNVDDTLAYVETELELEFLTDVVIPPLVLVPDPNKPGSFLPPPVGSFNVFDHEVRPAGSTWLFTLSPQDFTWQE